VLTLLSDPLAVPLFGLVATVDVVLIILLLRVAPDLPADRLARVRTALPGDVADLDPDTVVVGVLPLRTSGLLRPGVWIRRSHLVWALRGTDLPPHLLRTRIIRQEGDHDAMRLLWTRLLSRTIRRRRRVADRADGRARFDVIVRSKDGSRTVCIDTAERTVVHRANGLRLSDAQRDHHRSTFAHLRGPRLLAHDADGGFSEELLWGMHLLDADEATRLGVLSALLIDVIALTERTSRPASAAFRVHARQERGEELPDRYRTVLAPSTTSLDNVVLTGFQRIAWVDVFPIVECSFHLPWFGVAVRIADISPTVTEALEQGMFDSGMATLLRLGGAVEGVPADPLAVMRGLTWAVRPPEAVRPASAGRPADAGQPSGR